MATPIVGGKFFDYRAVGLSPGACLYTYAAGTLTPLATYTDAGGGSSNANPVVCNVYGQADVYLGTAAYRMRLYTDTIGNGGTLLWDEDNVQVGADKLRTDLASTASASLGASLVAQSTSLTFTPGPTVANGIKNYITPEQITGCPTDGTTDATTYIAAAFAAGKYEIIIPGGRTYVVDGNIAGFTKMRLRGEGTLKKKAGNIKPIILLNDEAKDILIEGVTFDGSTASFSSGNACPAILGYLNQWIKVHGCNFENIIDVGVKLRNGAYLELIGGKFYNIGQNGIELKNYDTDPRTGLAYTGTLPSMQGGHRIIGAWFGKIDDGNHGTGDGCGVLVGSSKLAAGTAYPIKGATVEGCDFMQVLRGVWTENNDAGCETEDFHVVNNRFRGDISAFGGETKDGIGFIGVKRAKAIGNTIINVGNFAPSGGTCAGVQISLTTNEYVQVENNTIIDNTGNANRMDHAVFAAAGSIIKIANNTVGGQSGNVIEVTSATVSELECHSNYGAQNSYSWSKTANITFKTQNIPGTATAALTPDGYEDDTEFTFPMPVRLVGVSVTLSAVITAGTITFKPYTNGVSRSNLDVATADFGAGTVGKKVIGITSGVTIAAGEIIRVDVVTAGFTPTTCDAQMTLIFDTTISE